MADSKVCHVGSRPVLNAEEASDLWIHGHMRLQRQSTFAGEECKKQQSCHDWHSKFCHAGSRPVLENLQSTECKYMSVQAFKSKVWSGQGKQSQCWVCKKSLLVFAAGHCFEMQRIALCDIMEVWGSKNKASPGMIGFTLCAEVWGVWVVCCSFLWFFVVFCGPMVSPATACEILQKHFSSEAVLIRATP